MARRKRTKQLSLLGRRIDSGRGGPRTGAGRKPRRGGHRRVPHRRRKRFSDRRAIQVTTRVLPHVTELRRRRIYRVLRDVFCKTCDQGQFRIVHYSVQSNHIHFVVEASTRAAMTAGMRKVNIRIGKQLNRAMGRKQGQVLDGRYHERHLETPTQVRNSLAYVLNNVRHHAYDERGVTYGPRWIDPCSSATYFDGYRERGDPDPLPDDPPVAPPRSWLLRAGWRRRGLIPISFIPARRRR